MNINLADLNGTNGFRLDGIALGDRSGSSVASAGDVNGDGIDDLIIGAKDADPGGRGEAGESYVVFGKVGGFDASLDLSSLNDTNGFRIDGIDAGEVSGRSVASAGDVNGDGIDDLIIGAYLAGAVGRSEAGESYVVFGKAGGFDASLSLSNLNGTNGFRIDGVAANDFSGHSVASAGDLNGNGINDLIIGALFADPGGRGEAGESYVVYGKTSGFGASLDLSSLNGTNGFRLDGIVAQDFSGYSVASAGDVNGDGVGDLIIGGHEADPGGRRYAGESYVVFGKTGGFAASLDLSSLNGTTGFRIDGIDAFDSSGRSVAAAGDVNGDGVADLIIGATGADPGGRGDAGESYVVFGTDSTVPTLGGDFRVTLAEGGSVGLTAADVAGSDAISGAAALTYTVSRPLRGFVALTGAPSVAITSFTQQQLAAGQVQFRHDGSETTSARFSVTLRDAAGNAAAARAVVATVTPTDDPLGLVTDVNATPPTAWPRMRSSAPLWA